MVRQRDRGDGPLINADGKAKVEAHVDDALAKDERCLADQRMMLDHYLFTDSPRGRHRRDADGLRRNLRTGCANLSLRSRRRSGSISQRHTIWTGRLLLYTEDLSRTFRVYEALDYGIIGVNTGIISTEVVPFGGVKESGLGREGGPHGIEEFLETKYGCIGIKV